MLPAKSLDIFSGTEDEENSRENVLREIHRPTIMPGLWYLIWSAGTKWVGRWLLYSVLCSMHKQSVPPTTQASSCWEYCCNRVVQLRCFLVTPIY